MTLINAIGTFFEGQTFIVYLMIFIAKMMEVSLSTLRQILINRGFRLVGSIIALVEITLWLFVAGTVLATYREDPVKMIPYALAYALGNYFGSWLDERLAFGMCSMQVVMIDLDVANTVADSLRSGGFGISEVNAFGMNNEPRYIIMSTVKRKELRRAMDLIQGIDSHAMITVSDIRSLRGGYLNPTPVHGFHVGHKK